jgi:hypothetical protein
MIGLGWSTKCGAAVAERIPSRRKGTTVPKGHQLVIMIDFCRRRKNFVRVETIEMTRLLYIPVYLYDVVVKGTNVRFAAYIYHEVLKENTAS